MREYDVLEEETTIGNNAEYPLDTIAFPNYRELIQNIGVLKVTNTLGDTNNDGKFEEIYTLGGRSFSIWNGSTGALVYDSGDDFEQITAKPRCFFCHIQCD